MSFRSIAAAAALIVVCSVAGVAAERTNLGRAVTADEIAAWNIDVSGDGAGLPAGRGSVAEGRALFAEACAACHGDKGQGGAADALVGGRGTLVGAALGAVVVNYAKTFFTSGVLAPYWLFMLGALFVLVTLLLPKGILGTFNSWWDHVSSKTPNADSAAREDGVTEPKMAE